MGKFRIKGDPFLIRQTCPLLLPGAACNIIDYKNANAKFEYQMFQVYRSLPCHFIIPSKDLWIIKTLGYLSRQELELNSSLRELIQTNLCHGCSDSRSKFYFRIKHIFSRASPDLKGFTSQATQVSTNNRQVTAKKITETFMDSTK